MTAAHFFAPSLAGDAIRITGDDARHALRVLRIRPGEDVSVADGTGALVQGTAEPDGDDLVVRVRARLEVPEARPRVHLHPAVPKSGKLELVVQKLTELGVASIRPWFAARTVVRWDEAKARANAERLRAVAHEAGKQSRSARLPLIEPAGAPPGAFPGPAFVLHGEAGAPLHDLLPAQPPGHVSLVVGPEGGLEPGEIAAFEAAGAVPVSLGRQVLRAETASIIGPALVMGRYLLLG